MTAIVTQFGDRTLRLTNLTKIMYPQVNVTKSQVVDYYACVADALIRQTTGRPVTRIRFPRGAESESFFEKNAPEGMPDWIPTKVVNSIHYPVFDEPAAVVWSAQVNALELHTPQWRDPDQVDRLVVDLDPGPGAGLAACCRVAVRVADLLAADGLRSHPVTSGSQGMQLYAPFPDPMPASAVLTYAKAMAVELARAHPEQIVASMTRSRRENRVLIDWSQNNPAKTTITPYSLRGKHMPFAATPVSWSEVRGGLEQQFLFSETMARLQERGDILAQ
jgi:bifunctional non-homologous end joining protein LigD